MAAFDTTRPIATENGLRNLIVSFYGAFVDWNDRRVTRDALNRLSDRELDDIGLGRGDIDAI